MNEHQRRLLDAMEFSSYIAAFAEPGRQILGIDYYAYTVDQQAVNITSAAAQQFQLIMDSDSDFVLTMMSGGSRIAAGAFPTKVEFTPALLIQITDQSSGKTFFNMATPLPLIAGSMGFPFLLSSPRVIKPRTTLTVQAQGAVAGAVFNDFFFVLNGAKIYYA